jgi:hypothetical protein
MKYAAEMVYGRISARHMDSSLSALAREPEASGLSKEYISVGVVY